MTEKSFPVTIMKVFRDSISRKISSFIKSEYFVLSAVLIFHLINNIVWVVMDTRPQAWDGSSHLNLCLNYIEALKEFDIWKFIAVAKFYPPFYHLSIIPFLLVSCFNSGVVVIPNWIYLCALVFFTHALGKKLFKDSTVAVLGAVLLSFYPFIQYLAAREILIDLALAAFVVAGLYYFTASENFSDRFNTRMFFIFSFIGISTKWNYLIFLFIPVLVGFIKCSNSEKKRILGYSLILIAGLIPFYGCNIVPMIGKIAHFMNIGMAEGDPSVLAIGSLLWYLLALGHQIQIIPALVFFTGLVFFIRGKYSKKWLLVSWIVFPYIIMTFISNKDMRYTTAFLPALALISAVPFSLIRGRKLKNALIAVFCAILVLQILHYNFKFSFLSADKSFFVKGRPVRLWSSYEPAKEDWKYDDILKFVKENGRKEEPFTLLSVVSNHPYLHGSNLRYFFRTRADRLFARGYKKRLGEFSEFILLKEGNRGPLFSLGAINKAAESIKVDGMYFSRNFSEAKTFDAPDGSKILLYQRDVKKWTGSELDSLKTHFETLRYGKRKAYDVDMELKPYPGKSWQEGYFEEIILRCGELDIKGFVIKDPVIKLKDVVLSLPHLLEKGELFLLALGAVEPELTIEKGALEGYLQKKAKNIKGAEFEFDHGINVFGRLGFVPITLKTSIKLRKDEIFLGVKKIGLFHIGIPGFLYRAHLGGWYTLEPTAEKPFRININNIDFTEKGITING